MSARNKSIRSNNTSTSTQPTSTTLSDSDAVLRTSLATHPVCFQATLLHRVMTTPIASTALSTPVLSTSACSACLRPWIVGVTVRVRLVRKRDRRRFVNAIVYSCVHCNNSLHQPAAAKGALKAALQGVTAKKKKPSSKKRPVAEAVGVAQMNQGAHVAKKSFKSGKPVPVVRPPPPTDSDRIAAAVRASKPTQPKPNANAKNAPTATKKPSLLSQFLSAL
jgi:RNase P subunit RPR2